MPKNKDRQPLKKRTSFSEEELNTIIEEVVIDTYSFEEELSAWVVYLEDELVFPFFVKVMGKMVQAIKLREKYEYPKLVVIFEERNHQIDITDVELIENDAEQTRNALILNAYCKWRKNTL